MESAPELVLYAFGPTRAARVEWVLAELELDYERVEVDLARGEHLQPEFRAISPLGRVPALRVGDKVLTESLALCTWIADRFGEGRLIPRPGTLERAEHDRWMYFLATELDAPLWRYRRHAVLYDESRRIEAEIPAARADFHEAARVFQDWLGGRSFALESLSVLDLCLAHTFHWASWSGQLDGLAELERYTAALLARPSCPAALVG